MKPAYKSKKVWAAVSAALGAVAAHRIGYPELAPLFAALGMALVVGIGLADFGKEGKALDAARLAEPANTVDTSEDDDEDE